MSEVITNVTDATFEAEVLASSDPVLVDYWAEWCAPCRAIAPLIDETAGTYAGQLRVAKLNIDENPEAPSKYQVRGIPTLMIFKDGRPVATQVGLVNRSQLSAFIESHL